MPVSTPTRGSATMPNSEVDHIIEAFKTWDESGSGMISREDLSCIIRALSPGIGESDLDKLFAAAASDGLPGNYLKYEDFVSWLWLPTPEDKTEKKAAAPVPPPKEAKRANPRPVKKAPSAASTASATPKAAAAPAAVPAPAASASTAPAFDAADEERRRRGLWEGTLKDAIAKGSRKYSAEKVERYFAEVQRRLAGEAYAQHVRNVIFCQVDSAKNGKVSFGQVMNIIGKSLQCANDMASEQKISVTREEIRTAFDAHDTLQSGRGFMGVDEFLNLMRYLQVCVAEAAMPMSQVIKGA